MLKNLLSRIFFIIKDLNLVFYTSDLNLFCYFPVRNDTETSLYNDFEKLNVSAVVLITIRGQTSYAKCIGYGNIFYSGFRNHFHNPSGGQWGILLKVGRRCTYYQNNFATNHPFTSWLLFCWPCYLLCVVVLLPLIANSSLLLIFGYTNIGFYITIHFTSIIFG